MALCIGIVGLPNVGKSTTFNALTKAQNAEAANYPFCTIEPNKAIVTVPDERLDKITAIVNPKQTIYTTIEFVDIAGLVEGASRGEGLGNKFLSHIREAAAIVHLVRCFEDENITHVSGAPDPASDVAVIETELMLADLQTLERRVERLTKLARGGDKDAKAQLAMAEAVQKHLEAGKLALNFDGRDDDAFIALNRETPLLTAKPVIFTANVDEEGLAEDGPAVEALRAIAAERGAPVVKLCAKVEEEMVGMDDAERHEFLESLGAAESGLEQVIRLGYQALGLQSFFTAGPKEARAWTVRKGARAPQAAGAIHTDFERGFIRAEVIAYDDFITHNGEAGAKTAGVLRIEGKEYVMADGDVCHFRFSV